MVEREIANRRFSSNLQKSREDEKEKLNDFFRKSQKKWWEESQVRMDLQPHHHLGVPFP